MVSFYHSRAGIPPSTSQKYALGGRSDDLIFTGCENLAVLGLQLYYYNYYRNYRDGSGSSCWIIIGSKVIIFYIRTQVFVYLCTRRYRNRGWVKENKGNVQVPAYPCKCGGFFFLFFLLRVVKILDVVLIIL